MAIQTFTVGQVLTAAQMNTLQKTVATYNAIGNRTTALSYTSGSIDTKVDTTNFSGTITAATGDLIQATWNSYIAAGSNIAHFNFYTFNGATPVNQFIVATSFNPFFIDTAYVGYVNFVSLYKVVAGDIFSNQVTVKLTGSTAGAARDIVNSSVPACFTVTNLGQVQ